MTRWFSHRIVMFCRLTHLALVSNKALVISNKDCLLVRFCSLRLHTVSPRDLSSFSRCHRHTMIASTFDVSAQSGNWSHLDEEALAMSAIWFLLCTRWMHQYSMRWWRHDHRDTNRPGFSSRDDWAIKFSAWNAHLGRWFQCKGVLFRVSLWFCQLLLSACDVIEWVASVAVTRKSTPDWSVMSLSRNIGLRYHTHNASWVAMLFQEDFSEQD
jgi:hypothetical protein